MEAFKGLKSFDAFPKVQSQHAVRSSRGGTSTVLLIIFVLFIAYVEIGDWFDGSVHRTFTVDDSMEDTLQINIDVVVAMPCHFLHTNILDFARDRTLAADYLSFEGVNFNIPQEYLVNDQRDIRTPDMDEIMRESLLAEFRTAIADNSGAPACHIFGMVPISRIAGDFHITAKGYTYRDYRSFVHPEALNFSHVFSEFSFGDFYPYLVNPLDFTAKTTDEHVTRYQYYISAVPTSYKRLGVEIETFQYGVTEQVKSFDHPYEGMPGIFIRYDFEAIKLVLEDRRMSFMEFVIHLVTIAGGVVICFSWGYRVLNKSMVMVFGERRAKRGEESARSFLGVGE